MSKNKISMIRIIVAQIGDDEFGINVDTVVEILKAQKIFPLPHMPSYISGVINTRGFIIPIIDIRARFGIKPQPVKERIIIVRSGDERIGLLVDGVKDILSLQQTEISPPPSIFKNIRTEYLTGIGKKADRIIIILNLDTLFSYEERMLIEEAQKTTGAANA